MNNALYNHGDLIIPIPDANGKIIYWYDSNTNTYFEYDPSQTLPPVDVTGKSTLIFWILGIGIFLYALSIK